MKVARVTSLHKDIAYAMASPDVRILAPIPGRSAIGVEVPNDAPPARRRSATSSPSPRPSAATHPLEVALGRDIAGRAVLANLADDAPPAHRRRHRRRQVVLHQLTDHLDPHALDARPGAA